MKKIIDNFLQGYKNGIQKAKKTSNIICPFCEQGDFDLEGLKNHLTSGYCDIYNKTKEI